MKAWEYCTQKQRIERWENVLRVLRAMTPHERRKHFNMATWGEKTPCGTVACAAGHCGLDPWFRRRGLKLDIFLLNEAYDGWPAEYTTNWNGVLEDHPVEMFFGITGSRDIFFSTAPRSVGTVIKEVMKYIKRLRSQPEECD